MLSRPYKIKMKTKVKRHIRRMKGKKIRVKSYVRKIFGSKPKQEFIEIDDPEFQIKAIVDQPEYLEKFGEAKRISGKEAGKIVAATGIIPLIPFPVTIPIGAGISKKVERVTIIKTGEHDEKLKIPKIFIETK